MEIKLVQKPIIEHQLQAVGKSIDDKLKELNINNLVATEDTVKSLKKTRAELNTEHTELKEQLKNVLSPITDPVTEIREMFKVNVTEKFKPADDLLKDKISSVEMKIKDEKKSNIEAYLSELCAAENIDFIKFTDLNLNINLSTSEKKYKEQCNEFIERVNDDLALIKTEEFNVEMLVEYKKSLNASKAITSVKQRKEEERIELQRAKQQETDTRKSRLLSIAVVYSQTERVYSYSDEIYVSGDKVENCTKEEFEDIFIKLQSDIKSYNKAKEESAPKVKIKEPEKPKAKEPLQAPVKNESQEMLSTSFTVTGTLPQLKALAAYMRENNINFKTLNNE